MTIMRLDKRPLAILLTILAVISALRCLVSIGGFRSGVSSGLVPDEKVLVLLAISAAGCWKGGFPGLIVSFACLVVAESIYLNWYLFGIQSGQSSLPSDWATSILLWFPLTCALVMNLLLLIPQTLAVVRSGWASKRHGVLLVLVGSALAVSLFANVIRYWTGSLVADLPTAAAGAFLPLAISLAGIGAGSRKGAIISGLALLFLEGLIIADFVAGRLSNSYVWLYFAQWLLVTLALLHQSLILMTGKIGDRKIGDTPVMRS